MILKNYRKIFFRNYIIAIFFKNENEIKVLSKIQIKENKVIKSSLLMMLI